MDQNCKAVVEKRIQRTMESLQKNNMQAYYAPTCADAVKIAKELLQPGDVLSCGGSVTLAAPESFITFGGGNALWKKLSIK